MPIRHKHFAGYDSPGGIGHAGLSGGAPPGNVLPVGAYGGVALGLECALRRLFLRAAGPKVIFCA